MNVNASYGKAINFYFGKLLFCSNQHELSFVVVKFELIPKHPRMNVRYTTFYGNDCICMISSQVRTKRQVKLRTGIQAFASGRSYLMTSKSLLEYLVSNNGPRQDPCGTP